MTDSERSTLIVNRTQRFAQSLIRRHRPITSFAAQSYAANLRRRLRPGQQRAGATGLPLVSGAQPLVNTSRRQVVERSVPRPDLVLPQAQQQPVVADMQPAMVPPAPSQPSATLSHTRQPETEQPSGGVTDPEASPTGRPSVAEVRERLTRPQDRPTQQTPTQTQREVETRRRLSPRSELVEEPEREVASAAIPESIEGVSEAIEAIEPPLAPPSTAEQETPVEQTPTETPPAPIRRENDDRSIARTESERSETVRRTLAPTQEASTTEQAPPPDEQETVYEEPMLPAGEAGEAPEPDEAEIAETSQAVPVADAGTATVRREPTPDESAQTETVESAEPDQQGAQPETDRQAPAPSMELMADEQPPVTKAPAPEPSSERDQHEPVRPEAALAAEGQVGPDEQIRRQPAEAAPIRPQPPTMRDERRAEASQEGPEESDSEPTATVGRPTLSRRAAEDATSPRPVVEAGREIQMGRDTSSAPDVLPHASVETDEAVAVTQAEPPPASEASSTRQPQVRDAGAPAIHRQEALPGGPPRQAVRLDQAWLAEEEPSASSKGEAAAEAPVAEEEVSSEQTPARTAPERTPAPQQAPAGRATLNVQFVRRATQASEQAPETQAPTETEATSPSSAEATPTAAATSGEAAEPEIDLDELADQVYRRIRDRLRIERERQTRAHRQFS